MSSLPTELIEKMGLPNDSSEARLLIQMITWTLYRRKGNATFSDEEGFLAAAAAMIHNESAVSKVAELTSISLDRASDLLYRQNRAAKELAEQYGFSDVVVLAERYNEKMN